MGLRIDTMEELERRSQSFFSMSYEDLRKDLIAKKTEDMKEVLSRLGIRAMTKTIPESLPAQGTIFIVNDFSSYVNATFFTENLNRKVAKFLIDNNVRDVRFYITVEPRIDPEELGGGINGLIFSFHYHIGNKGKVKN